MSDSPIGNRQSEMHQSNRQSAIGNRKSTSVTIVAGFSDFHSMERALERVSQSDIRDYEAYGPIPLEDIERLMPPRRPSLVRTLAGLGGIVGVCGGFALAIFASQVYEIITGGKPPVSFLPFCIIGFEFTILIACLATFIAVTVFARLKPTSPPADYDPRYSDEHYGIHVRCLKEKAGETVRLFEDLGAKEIREL